MDLPDQCKEVEVHATTSNEQWMWFAVVERFLEDLVRPPGKGADGKDYRARAIKDWLTEREHMTTVVMPNAGISQPVIDRTIRWVNQVINVEVINQKDFPPLPCPINARGEVLLFNKNFRKNVRIKE